MSDLYQHVAVSFSVLNWHLVLLAAVLFTLGLVLADLVLERNIHWLIAYPIWAFRILDAWMKKFSRTMYTFLFILTFNSFNLFVGLASGLAIVMPVILAIWSGMNVGIILRKITAGKNGVSPLMIFFNPVALFELPAAWIAFSIGFEMMIQYLTSRNYQDVLSLFVERIPVFFWLVIPLLIIAGLIESALIHYLKGKIEQDDE